MEPTIERHGVRVEGFSVPFHTRAGSIGDAGVLKQVFASKDYLVDMWAQGRALRALHASLVAEGSTPLIIDAGANIGAASLYFSVLYGGSRVVAIEPDASNCELLERNTRGRDVQRLQAGLASVAGSLAVENPGLGDWGFRTKPATASDGAGSTVDAVTIGDILSAHADCTPFICKIDIEGAEGELFSRPSDWMDRFPLVVVELHDWMLPFAGTSRGFLREVASRDVDFVYRGDNIFVFSGPLLRAFS